MAAGQTTPPPSIPPLPQQPPSFSVQAPMAATSSAPSLLTPPPPQNHPSSSVEHTPPAPAPPSFWDKCMERLKCLLRIENCVHHFWDYTTACLDCGRWCLEMRAEYD